MIDLSEYEAAADAQEAGVRVDLLDPTTGEPTGASITVCGPDSRKARKARREAISKAQNAGVEVDYIDIATQMLARCVVSWEGLRWGGTDMPLTVENAVKVFERFPWIESQVDRKASDRRNFTTG